MSSTDGRGGLDPMNDPEKTKALDQMMSRADHLLMLEFGDPADFDDQRLEWRRLFSEVWSAGPGPLRAQGTPGGRDRAREGDPTGIAEPENPSEEGPTPD